MRIEGIKNNLKQMKEIVRELSVLSNQLLNIKRLEFKGSKIDNEQKRLLNESIYSLLRQLKILNNSIPGIFEGIDVNTVRDKNIQESNTNLAKVIKDPSGNKDDSLLILEKDKKAFLEDLKRSRYSVKRLREKYSVEKANTGFRNPSTYAKMSNYLFKKYSYSMINGGYFRNLNLNLRRVNSPFVINTYVSMMILSSVLAFIFSIFIYLFLLFFDVSLLFPFISIAKNSIIIRMINFIWIIFAVPLMTALILYFYPYFEAKNIGDKINQELPFVTIHMAAVASSGIEPVSIFEILVKGGDYRYVSVEFKKLLNLVNFHGLDIITSLNKISESTSSSKLKELLNGLATTIKSGGDMHIFLNKHAENMMFDYKLDRERYTRISETFMDIYISIAIAAPMILLMLFIIIGSTGLSMGIFNMGTTALSFLIIFVIILLNILFLFILQLKQPPM